MPAATTLWDAGASPDQRLLEATAGEDRPWDARLLRWDVLGSLGHVEGLRASGLLSRGEHARLRAGLRRALAAVDQGTLRLGPSHEDAHTAVEDWLTRRLPGLGERLHTGRSRNDQVVCDLRLLLKDRLLTLADSALALVEALLAFAGEHDLQRPGTRLGQARNGQRHRKQGIGLWHRAKSLRPPANRSARCRSSAV